jgi:uncharacterized damage-inducible protein DinB
MTQFPEPSSDTADPTALFSRYLSFYRDTVARKVRSLSEVELRTSRLPSGWTPVQLVSHLLHMERRWFVWGHLGEPVEAPWGDQQDGLWYVPEDVPLEALLDELRQVGERTSQLLAERPLDERSVPGGRFDEDPPTLAWICFHVLQEYARHAGHLDVAVELAGGEVGE